MSKLQIISYVCKKAKVPRSQTELVNPKIREFLVVIVVS